MIRTGGRLAAVVLVVLTLGAPGGSAGVAASQTLRGLLVKLSWGPEPISGSQFDAVVSDASAFYRTASFGQLTLTFDQTDWLPVSEKQVSCSTFQQARQMPKRLRSVAANAGYDLSAYNRVVFVFPTSPCAISGLYEPDGILINGTWGDSVLIHELGHSLGMGHAGSVTCRYTRAARFCRSDIYGDSYDVMGQGVDSGSTTLPPGDFGALQKARAGWITPVFVARRGVYRLAALEQPSSLPQALVIRGSGRQFWIDYREAQGNDAYLKSDPLGITSGFEVHSFAGDPLTGSRIYPNAADYLLPRDQHGQNVYATPPGRTFTEHGAFSLTALSRTNSTITLRFRWLDIKVPTAPKIIGIHGHDSPVSPLKIRFRRSVDHGSGVGRYRIRIDGHTAAVLTPPIRQPKVLTATLGLVAKGTHTLTVRSFDHAGNGSAIARAHFRAP